MTTFEGMIKFWNDGKRVAVIAGVVAASVITGGYIYQQRRKSSQVDPDIRPEGRSKDITTKFLDKAFSIKRSSSRYNNLSCRISSHETSPRTSDGSSPLL